MTKTMSKKGWIGVDLDGTLAKYVHWRGIAHIGDPVPLMQSRVLNWLREGREVRILTARVSPMSLQIGKTSLEDTTRHIDDWCLKHLGTTLPVTCQKDLAMVEYWDDRCVQVVPNTGLRADKVNDGLDCPYCDNIGWLVVAAGDPRNPEPMQEQCEWCYTVPNSKFNIDQAREAQESQGQPS